MSADKPRQGWGGKRPGSGRPAGTRTAPPRIRFGFSLPEPEAERLNQAAANDGVTVHNWIVTLVRRTLGMEEKNHPV